MIYEDGAISVDEKFVRVGTKSYSIRQITSIELREGKPRVSHVPDAWGIAAIVALQQAFARSIIVLAVAAVACAYMTFRTWQNRIVRDYQLFFTSTAGEIEALKTSNRTAVLNLRNAIEEASR